MQLLSYLKVLLPTANKTIHSRHDSDIRNEVKTTKNCNHQFVFVACTLKNLISPNPTKLYVKLNQII